MSNLKNIEIEEWRFIENVPNGSFIKIQFSNGSYSQKVYIKRCYDFQLKRYICEDFYDQSKLWLAKKGSIVLVGFTFND